MRIFCIFLCFINLFAVYDGGYDVGLGHLLNVVVQELYHY